MFNNVYGRDNPFFGISINVLRQPYMFWNFNLKVQIRFLEVDKQTSFCEQVCKVIRKLIIDCF